MPESPIEGQTKVGPFKTTLLQICEDVESGSSLSEAMAKHPGVFDPLYTNMVKAGEAGGILDTILQRLAEFKEKSQRLRNKVKGAAAYPIVVMLVAIAKVHAPHGFFLNFAGTPGKGHGFEFNFALIAMALSILIGGAGVLSADRAIWLALAGQE